ncbi:3-oxoacyl-[acyl-carrier-protein] reductase FabG [bacterium HR29]|jgi:NAD(P)-dependent dehydrogenase (short-subunit alcohol dehydrogenase family)|nr:3-oxoacyl-[acyl-carrier-protein] reductase FabG [bacterium HR29]
MSLSSLFSLEGKTAVVTGASYGLGVTFAETLAEAGANVVLAARSLDKLEATAASLGRFGVRTLAVRCDVADASQVAALAARAWEAFGRVDILVNNAGVSAEAGIFPERVPHELFEQTVRVNLLGTWYCCREFGARMLADGRGGSIVNVASIAGLNGQPHFPAAYQATKAAVINLTRNLAASWADRGVRVNALAPGWFPSQMTAAWFAVPQFLERFRAQAAMNRVGDPRELKGPLLLLASEAGSFITGQVLAVDGGASAMTGGHYTPELYALLEGILGELGTPIRPAPVRTA